MLSLAVEARDERDRKEQRQKVARGVRGAGKHLLERSPDSRSGCRVFRARLRIQRDELFHVLLHGGLLRDSHNLGGCSCHGLPDNRAPVPRTGPNRHGECFEQF